MMHGSRHQSKIAPEMLCKSERVSSVRQTKSPSGFEWKYQSLTPRIRACATGCFMYGQRMCFLTSEMFHVCCQGEFILTGRAKGRRGREGCGDRGE